jgi:internalin A
MSRRRDSTDPETQAARRRADALARAAVRRGDAVLGIHETSLDRAPAVMARAERLRELFIGGNACFDPELPGWRMQARMAVARDDRYSRSFDMSAVGGLTGLRLLDVSRRPLADTAPLFTLTGLQMLSVRRCGLSSLNGFEVFRDLRVLDLSYNPDIEDLSPIAALVRLEHLDISGCTRLRNLDVLFRLSGLKTLGARNIDRAVDPQLLDACPALGALTVDAVDGCPQELIQEHRDAFKVAAAVRAWWSAVSETGSRCNDVKVFVLGNGGVGKTQLVRRLTGEVFDPSTPSTHGISLGRLDVGPAAGPDDSGIAFWDFGGQEIYHGTHALFMDARAVVLLAWSADAEQAGAYEENGLRMRHRPLDYWVRFVHAYVGTGAALLLVHAKCDLPSDLRVPLSSLPPHEGPLHLSECSALSGEGIEELRLAVVSAARRLRATKGDVRIPTAWLRAQREVDRLRAAGRRTLAREEFDTVCRMAGAASAAAVLLEYLHLSGQVFYRDGLFRDQVIVDLNWALEAVYALVDRRRVLPYLV